MEEAAKEIETLLKRAEETGERKREEEEEEEEEEEGTGKMDAVVAGTEVERTKVMREGGRE